MSEIINQVKAVKAGIGTGSGITQGSWEAEGNVIVIRPERNCTKQTLLILVSNHAQQKV